MELLTGLLVGGKYLSNKKEKYENTKTRKAQTAKPNSRNIYSSKRFKEGYDTFLNKTKEKFTDSLYPEQTGVIPNSYNKIKYWGDLERKRKQTKNHVEPFDADSVFSDDTQSQKSLDNKSLLSMEDHTALYKKADRICDNKYQQQRSTLTGNKIKNGAPGFLSQFEELKFDNPGKFVASNSIPKKSGAHCNVARNEMERDLALQGGFSSFDDNTSMTYDVTDKKNFTHNNMVPFYSKTAGYGCDPLMQKNQDYVKQRKMELFTGSLNNVDYRPKTERRPLFNPLVGLTNIYGMPNFTNYMETRYIPSRERRNEFPVQPVRVTPGLNLGYNEVSKQGYHDYHRALPRTTNQLRAANNPKITYEKPIIHGMKGYKRGTIPNVAKRRPVTFFENDPRNFVKSLGYVRAPRIRGNWDVPLPNRTQTSKAWSGPAKFVRVDSQHRPESMLEKVKISHKENFNQPMARGVGIGEIGKGHAFDMQAGIPDPTMRNLSENKTYQGPLGTLQHQKGHAFDMGTNIPEPTMRNLSENKTYQGPVGTLQHHKGGYGPEQDGTTAVPTMRQLSQNKTYQGPLGTLQHHKGGYGPEQDGTTAAPTMRQMTQNKTYQGPLGTLQHHKGGYGPCQDGTQAPPTMRQLTQNKTIQGPLGTLQHHKGGYIPQLEGTIAPPTMRQLTQNKTIQGPLGTLQHHKGGYLPELDGTNAPPTMRQLTQNKTIQGPLGTLQHHKGGYLPELSGTNAPPTMRQLTQNKTIQAPLGTQEHSRGGYKAALAGTIAPPTMRQLTQNKTIQAPLGTQQHEKGGYIAAQDGTIAPPTMRQLTQKKTIQGPLGTQEHEKGGYGPEQDGTVAPPTMRQLTQNKTWINPTGSIDREKYRSRRDAKNSYINVNKEEIAKGRYPTTSNYEKGPTYEYTMVNLCEPIQVNRELYGHRYGANVNQCIPKMYTQMGYSLPQTGYRSYTTHIGENLATNPYINNTQHKTVEY